MKLNWVVKKRNPFIFIEFPFIEKRQKIQKVFEELPSDTIFITVKKY